MIFVMTLGLPLALIAGAILEERKKERERRLREMERKALKELKAIKKEMGLK